MFYKVSFINIRTTRVLFIQFVSDQASSAVGEGSDELLTGLHEGLGPGSEVRLVWIIWVFFAPRLVVATTCDVCSSCVEMTWDCAGFWRAHKGWTVLSLSHRGREDQEKKSQRRLEGGDRPVRLRLRDTRGGHRSRYFNPDIFFFHLHGPTKWKQDQKDREPRAASGVCGSGDAQM